MQREREHDAGARPAVLRGGEAQAGAAQRPGLHRHRHGVDGAARGRLAGPELPDGTAARRAGGGCGGRRLGR